MQRIVTEATRLFSQQSYPSTSMRDIGEAVGVMAGSLYSHISSKESILLAIVEAGINKFLEAVRPISDSNEPADQRMRAAVEAHVAVVASDVEATMVVFHQWRYLGDENRRKVVRNRKAYEELFARIVRDGVDSGIFDVGSNQSFAVLAILGTLNWVPEWYSRRAADDASEIGAALANVIIGGLTQGIARPVLGDSGGLPGQ